MFPAASVVREAPDRSAKNVDERPGSFPAAFTMAIEDVPAVIPPPTSRLVALVSVVATFSAVSVPLTLFSGNCEGIATP
jgi:hypothetical protein